MAGPATGSGHGFLSGPGPILLAHRGGAGEALENSPTAFQHSVELGLTHIETDVRASLDGTCVVIHDDTLDRVTDGTGPVQQLTWAQLRSVRMRNGDRLMTLSEALERFPSTRFNVDVKCDAAVGPFLATLRRTGAWDRVCAASFSDRRLHRIRRLAGRRLATSSGTGEVAAMVLRAWPLLAPRACDLRPIAAQVPLRLGGLPVATTAFVAAAHRWGLAVHVWTVDDPAQIDQLLHIGADGIVTDVPTLAAGVLRAFLAKGASS